MRRLFFIIFLFPAMVFSQQTPQFSQYLLNEYGLNPAAGGGSNCVEILFGARQQWVGFENAPQTQFLSVRKTFGKSRFATSGWHTVGIYGEQDKNEIIKTQSASLSYAYQMKLTSKYIGSAGLRLGYRTESVTAELANSADPALANLPAIVQQFPDISLGVRVYSSKTFYGLSVKQVYKNKLKKIGTPSILKPQFYVFYGYSIESSKYYYSYLPSAHVKFSYLAPPSVELSFMMYMKKKIGVGLSYRFNEAVVGMVNIRWKGLNIGIAYDLVVSKLRAGSSSSREIMVGGANCATGLTPVEKHGCPAYDF